VRERQRQRKRRKEVWNQSTRQRLCWPHLDLWLGKWKRRIEWLHYTSLYPLDNCRPVIPVNSQCRPCAICSEQSGIWVRFFSEYFDIILSIISSMLLMKSHIVRRCTIGPVENAAPKRIVLPNPKPNRKDKPALCYAVPERKLCDSCTFKWRLHIKCTLLLYSKQNRYNVFNFFES